MATKELLICVEVTGDKNASPFLPGRTYLYSWDTGYIKGQHGNYRLGKDRKYKGDGFEAKFKSW